MRKLKPNGSCKLGYKSDGTCAVDQLYKKSHDLTRSLFPGCVQRIENVPEPYSKKDKDDFIFILSGGFNQPGYECNRNCKFFASPLDVPTASERSLKEGV